MVARRHLKPRTRSADLAGAYELPDIISELQEATSLTRKTLVDVLTGRGKLGEFIGNPNDFIAMVKRNLLNVRRRRRCKTASSTRRSAATSTSCASCRPTAQRRRDRFLDRVYETKSFADGKTDFNYIQIDSDGAEAPERVFAEKLDSREDVKFFMKLPDKFKIETPVGPYNPDWAIIKQDGRRRIAST